MNFRKSKQEQKQKEISLVDWLILPEDQMAPGLCAWDLGNAGIAGFDTNCALTWNPFLLFPGLPHPSLPHFLNQIYDVGFPSVCCE